MDPIITPAFLNKGDQIGIIAPARSLAPRDLELFIRFIEARGYGIVTGDKMFGSAGQFSGSTEERLFDLHKIFTHPEVKAVICARGGYGSAQLLKSIDWEVIRENPKWLIGFSDITALHSAFGKFMETIHGVMPYSMIMDPPQDTYSFNYLMDILEGKELRYELAPNPSNFPGTATGPITGGNLSVLYSLAGTSYEPDYEGKILFLEDLDEYLYHIDRMILNLELRDIFRKISGLIVGDFSDIHDNTVPFGMNVTEIIAERAYKYNIPTSFGFPSGHKKRNFPQIFGRVSTLTVDGKQDSLVMYKPKFD